MTSVRRYFIISKYSKNTFPKHLLFRFSPLLSLSPYTLNFAGRIRSQVLKPNLEQGRPPSLLPKFTYPSTQRPISQTYNIEIVEILIAQNANYMEPWDDICDKQ